MPSDAAFRPLAGVRVLEFSTSIAGPLSTMILAQLGADVVKVESPEGDDARGWPPHIGDRSVVYRNMSVGKRGIVVDLKHPDGVAVALRLAQGADVVLQTMRPGVADRLGIGDAAVRAGNPDVLYYDMNAFGTGPTGRTMPGYDPMAQAYVGIMEMTGHDGTPPTRCAPSLIDLGTGMWTVIGALTALHDRDRTGKGSVVTTSLFETALGWVARHAADFGATGQIPPRVGTGHNSLTPYQAFEAADGPLVIAAGNDRLFAKLAVVLGHPEWSSEERFASNAQRTINRDALLPMISRVLLEKTVAEWIAALEPVGVPCSPIQSVSQVVNHEQTRAIGMLLDAPSDQLKIFGLPFSIDGRRPGFGSQAPTLGEHQAEINAATSEATA